MNTPYVLPDNVAGASIYLSAGSDPISNTATAMIPEPSVVLLSGLGALALLRRRR